MTKIAVLGCGPAGLLAAHAFARAGFDPVIISHKQKSSMFGAMYLHRAIPEVTNGDPDFHIRIEKLGTREQYARKVYGNSNAECSWDSFETGDFPAWSLRHAYAQLWAYYHAAISDAEIDANAIERIRREFDIVVSTIPLPAICNRRVAHHFRHKTIWVVNETQPPIARIYGGAYMMYIGHPAVSFYRMSEIDGIRSTEYADHFDAKFSGVSEGYKPIDTNCDCWPFVHRMGRFGKWQRGVLTHHAFEEAEALANAL